jgi:Rad3-related DNA helicase
MVDLDADLDAAFAALPGLQPRPGQRAMAAAVGEAVATGRPLLVHAPTGIGKSWLTHMIPVK